MPWVIGGGSSLTWPTARDKVRLDLWRKGTTALPDDVVDRALHASILDIESRRKWQWLENLVGSLELDTAASQLDLPAACGAVQSLSVFQGSNPWSDPLELVPMATVRSMIGNSGGYPVCYAISNGIAFFDSIAPASTRFELLFQAKCPDAVEAAVESPPITLSLHQQAVLAGAKALVALEYLHDDDKARRNSAAFDSHIARMEDRDDQQRGSDAGGSIQPNTDLFTAAHGIR